MVTFLGFSETTCTLIICACAGINFLNACIVARYARRRFGMTDGGTLLVFFLSLCTGARAQAEASSKQQQQQAASSSSLRRLTSPPSGLFSWMIFCCEPDSQTQCASPPSPIENM